MSTTVAARIDRLINDESKTKAYATLTINDTFAIHGVRLIQGKMVFCINALKSGKGRARSNRVHSLCKSDYKGSVRCS